MQKNNDSVKQQSQEPKLILLGRIANQSFAIPGDHVERVLRMVAITPLPGAPRGVAGVLNIHGTIVPVIDTYQRLGLPTPAFHPSQQLVIIHAKSPYALWLDQIEQVVSVDENTGLKAEVGGAVGYGSELATHFVQVDGCLVPLLSVEALDLKPVINESLVVSS